MVFVHISLSFNLAAYTELILTITTNASSSGCRASPEYSGVLEQEQATYLSARDFVHLIAYERWSYPHRKLILAPLKWCTKRQALAANVCPDSSTRLSRNVTL